MFFYSRVHIVFVCLFTIFFTACSGSNGDGNSDTGKTFSLNGSVNGLNGVGLSLTNSNGDELIIDTNGKFTFAVRLNDESDYEITVAGQPNDPVQICTIENGYGKVQGADVANVIVNCVDSYTLSGSVSGLAGSGLIL